jgi:uncharacterized protein (DUF2235 family)
MGKNILIFSDGTGQAGGISFDETRSNIYKLYRATRVGPDSPVNPAEQIAYYDAGLGSKPPSGGAVAYYVRKVHNLISQATGLGLTANIIDCYEMLVRLWQPGDRIYLFGFSRGAYTVRCLGGVLALCGVPTRERDGSSMKRDTVNARRIAKRAVKRVYQYTTSRSEDLATPLQKRLLQQRRELARRFREQHGSGLDDQSNAYPYFIGVFDTVAALANTGLMLILSITLIVLALALAGGILWVLGGSVLTWLVVATIAVVALLYFVIHLRGARGMEHGFWSTLHLTDLKQKFYDTELNVNVPYARHALSIDENRADFDRVKWGSVRALRPPDPSGIHWFEQIWFAGNHSDIGGGYPENEARLSDITLKWMVDAASSVPYGINVDQAVLRLYPSAAGPQHDEVKKGLGFLSRRIGINWKVGHRKIPDDAIVHPSVSERFTLPGVLQYDITAPYRPEPLRQHKDLSRYYGHPGGEPS